MVLRRQAFSKGTGLEVEPFYAPLVGGVYTVPYQGRKWMDDRSLPVPSRLTDSIELDEVCLDQGVRASSNITPAISSRRIGWSCTSIR